MRDEVKQASCYRLSDNGDRYELPVQFRGNDRIISATFPQLMLTAQEIFAAGQ